MPEIAEVGRVVHYLKAHLRNRRIANVLTTEDDIVYGKAGTSAEAFKKAMTGRTVIDAKQQGKYFWLEMDKPPHALLHFSMTGWMKLTNVETGYYRSKAEEKKDKSGKPAGPDAVYNNAGSTRQDEQEWPPRFMKFVLQMEGEPKLEAAFVDPRRLGRIRLVDVPATEMRNTSPLKENGPDPVIDKKVLTEEWLTTKLRSKKSPVKAVLLDQGNISGIGNWVGDEVLHHASIHPEQYSNTLNDEQCKQLHKSLMFVCDTACGLLGDSNQYPSDWLFKYRWNKGKKGSNVMPNGEKIVHLTVGGRTSAIVPTRQKKTGPVAGDLDDDEEKEDDDDDAGGGDAPEAETNIKPKSKRRSSKKDIDNDKQVKLASQAKRSRSGTIDAGEDAAKEASKRRTTRTTHIKEEQRKIEDEQAVKLPAPKRTTPRRQR